MTSAAPRIVVMGSAGSGKSLIGAALAARMRARFLDGDDVARRSVPPRSTPADVRTRAARALWLEAIAYALTEQPVLVVAAEPLTRAEREGLTAKVGGLWWVELVEFAPAAQKRRWWSRRARETEAPPAREALASDERGVRVANDAGLEDIVSRIVTVWDAQSLR